MRIALVLIALVLVVLLWRAFVFDSEAPRLAAERWGHRR